MVIQAHGHTQEQFPQDQGVTEEVFIQEDSLPLRIQI